MEEKKSNKDRLLFLLHYLQEHTDNTHGVTRKDMEAALQEAGFRTNAKTLDDDLNTLLDSPYFPIDKSGFQGSANHFFYMHTFDPAELKMLIDAVSAARFLPVGAATRLTTKLANLSQETKGLADTTPGNHVVGTASNLLSELDSIQQAIQAGKQITFQYYEYDASKRLVPHNNGEVYTCSPYAFAWNEDRYYLLGQLDKRPRIINPMCADLIYNTRILEEPALPPPDGFSPESYANEVFKMFSDGDVQDVILEAPVALMKNFIARFGEKFPTADVGNQQFRATVPVSISQTFFAWVFQFNGKVKVIGPQPVKEAYEEMLQRTLDQQLP